MTCQVCDGKRYLVIDRYDEGQGTREVIERCDACGWHGVDHPASITDEDALRLAEKDGFVCDQTYPFVIRERPIVYRPQAHVRLWDLVKRAVKPIV